MSFTRKQELFIEHYLEHGNAAKAAREAGYNTKYCGQVGYILLRNDKIRNEISARVQNSKEFYSKKVVRFLNSVLGGNDINEEGNEQIPTIKDRMKAAELLGKKYKVFEETEETSETPIIVYDI